MTNPQSDVGTCICRNYDGSGIDQHGNDSCPVHSVEAQTGEILDKVVSVPWASNAGAEALNEAVAKLKRLLIRERRLGASEKPQPQEEVGGKQVVNLSVLTKDLETVKALVSELATYHLLFGEIKDPYGKVDVKLAFQTYKDNESFHQNFGRYVEALQQSLEGAPDGGLEEVGDEK